MFHVGDKLPPDRNPSRPVALQLVEHERGALLPDQIGGAVSSRAEGATQLLHLPAQHPAPAETKIVRKQFWIVYVCTPCVARAGSGRREQGGGREVWACEIHAGIESEIHAEQARGRNLSGDPPFTKQKERTSWWSGGIAHRLRRIDPGFPVPRPMPRAGQSRSNSRRPGK